MPLLLCLSAVVLLLLAHTASAQDPAEMVVHNARIWTGDPDRPSAEWLAVAKGQVVALGDGDGWQAHAGEETRRIDAGGRRVLPGLIDAHVHLDMAADDLRTLDLRPAESREQLLGMLKEYTRSVPAGAWVVGTRWSSESWPDQRPSNADEIDEATGGRPAVLVRMDGHSILAGRSALEAAGITREGPADPEGGTIGRDADGNPTGAVYEEAMGLVYAHMVQPEADMQALLRKAVAEANRHGVTSVGAIESRETTQTLAEMDKGNGLSLRVAVSLRSGADDIADWIPLLEWGAANRQPSEHVSVVGFKGFMDGSLGSRTAWMNEPYDDNHLAEDKANDNAGYPLAMAADGELEELIRKGAEMGLQPAVHAIGDKANHVLLNWFETLPAETRRTLRPRVEHTQHLLPQDIARFGELNVVASMQPYHKADDGRYAEQRLGPERIKSSYAFRSLLDSGATLAFGSDWPVVSVNPFLGIHAAVTARTLDGDIFVPEQSITVEEALTAYTRGAATALRMEDQIGTLRETMAADFIVLDRDILEIDPEEIDDTQVTLTVVGGKVAHQR